MPKAKTPATAFAIDPKAAEPLELWALSIAGKQAKRDLLAVGRDQPIDITIRLKGTVDVCEPTVSFVDKAPKAEQLLAVVFAALTPAAREKAVTAAVAAFGKLAKAKAATEPGDSLAEKPAGDAEAELLGITPAASMAVAALLEGVTVQTKQQKAGSITGKIEVTVTRRGGR